MLCQLRVALLHLAKADLSTLQAEAERETDLLPSDPYDKSGSQEEHHLALHTGRGTSADLNIDDHIPPQQQIDNAAEEKPLTQRRSISAR